MRTAEEIKAEIIRLARKIGAPDHYLPFYPYTTSWDGCLDFEVDHRGYHLLNIFRGTEESRFTTHDLDALLYRAMKSVVWNLAQERAVEARAIDQARAHSKHAIVLMSALSPEWGDRRAQEESE